MSSFNRSCVGLRMVLLLVVLSVLRADFAEGFTLGGTSSSQLGWRSQEISFRANFTDCGVSEAVMNRALDKALEVWNRVPSSGLVLKRGSDVTTTLSEAKDKISARENGNPGKLNPEMPEILCSTDFEAETGSPAAVVAGTSAYIAPKGPYLEYAYIVLNSENGATASIGAKLEEAGENFLAILIGHEIGHALGLGHTSDKDALMYFNITEKEKLALSQDDMDGISYLYPRQEFGEDPLFGCGTIRGTPDGSRTPLKGGMAGGFLMFFGGAFFLWFTARIFKTASARA